MPFSSAAFCKSHLKEGTSSMNEKLDWIFKHQHTSVSPWDSSESWSSSCLLSCWSFTREVKWRQWSLQSYIPANLRQHFEVPRWGPQLLHFQTFPGKKVSQKFCKMFYPGLESTRSVRSLNKILQKRFMKIRPSFNPETSPLLLLHRPCPNRLAPEWCWQSQKPNIWEFTSCKMIFQGWSHLR